MLYKASTRDKTIQLKRSGNGFFFCQGHFELFTSLERVTHFFMAGHLTWQEGRKSHPISFAWAAIIILIIPKANYDVHIPSLLRFGQLKWTFLGHICKTCIDEALHFKIHVRPVSGCHTGIINSKIRKNELLSNRNKVRRKIIVMGTYSNILLHTEALTDFCILDLKLADTLKLMAKIIFYKNTISPEASFISSTIAKVISNTPSIPLGSN